MTKVWKALTKALIRQIDQGKCIDLPFAGKFKKTD